MISGTATATAIELEPLVDVGAFEGVVANVKVLGGSTLIGLEVTTLCG